MRSFRWPLHKYRGSSHSVYRHARIRGLGWKLCNLLEVWPSWLRYTGVVDWNRPINLPKLKVPRWLIWIVRLLGVGLILLVTEIYIDRFLGKGLPNLGNLLANSGVPSWVIVISCIASWALAAYAATTILKGNVPVAFALFPINPMGPLLERVLAKETHVDGVFALVCWVPIGSLVILIVAGTVLHHEKARVRGQANLGQ